MLAAREESWAELQAGAASRLEELAGVFGGRQQLSRVQQNKVHITLQT